jgi:hypothetical protein
MLYIYPFILWCYLHRFCYASAYYINCPLFEKISGNYILIIIIVILTPYNLITKQAVLPQNSLHVVKTSEVTNPHTTVRTPSAHARSTLHVRCRFSLTGTVIPGRGGYLRVVGSRLGSRSLEAPFFYFFKGLLGGLFGPRNLLSKSKFPEPSYPEHPLGQGSCSRWMS